jgi:RNA-directed DNA polymerase
MSALATLKAATSLNDVAIYLGYQPKHLAYLVRVMPPKDKYTEFTIPKRSGGIRTISAPQDKLKQLQRRLSDRLQDCLEEIDAARGVTTRISHGFKRGGSITTNASAHRRRRFVLNLDLSDFFGTINFGRVRGYFIKSRDFALSPEVATLIAQIACHNNSLPQGSPCSPVISNLIGNILDMDLLKLARATGCSYSRYADDLTFSTSKDPFPSQIAARTQGDPNIWQIGAVLEKAVARADFKLNSLKTRMQYCESRQTVTGIVVNKRLNTPIEFRRRARAMVHRLLKTGVCEIPAATLDSSGKSVVTNQPATVQRLEGVLTHILAVDKVASRHEVLTKKRVKDENSEPSLKPNEKLLRDLLFYRYFAAHEMPTILTEGKTDRIYLSCALKSMSTAYPSLVVSATPSTKLAVKLFKFSERNDHLLHLGGGTGDFIAFLKSYRKLYQRVQAPKGKSPVVILLDNDSGSTPVKKFVQNFFKVQLSSNLSTHLFDNVYLVLTPLKSGSNESCIEDCFNASTLAKKLNGKSFNYNDSIDTAKEYGKQPFAEKVVKASAQSIDFTGFKPLLDAIASIVATHA